MQAREDIKSVLHGPRTCPDLASPDLRSHRFRILEQIPDPAVTFSDVGTIPPLGHVRQLQSGAQRVVRALNASH